jgi:hypothetical protein
VLVSLGCGLGNTFLEFIRTGAPYFGEDVRMIRPAECLGIDRNYHFHDDLVNRNLQFLQLDLLECDLAVLPAADYYMAWNYLHANLPDKEWMAAVVETMIHKARKGVWLRIPSFEQDEATGELALKEFGLRFAWTKRWSPYLLHDLVTAINAYKVKTKRGSLRLKIKPAARVRTSQEPCVVPENAPLDATEYHPSMGERRVTPFDPPLVSQWDVVVTM